MDVLIGKMTNALTSTMGSLLTLLGASAAVAIVVLAIMASISDDQQKARNMKSVIKVLVAVIIGACALALVEWILGF